MKHDPAQLFICRAEHPLMLHGLWTPIACQRSRQSLQGISFSLKEGRLRKQEEKTNEGEEKEEASSGHNILWEMLDSDLLELFVIYAFSVFLQEIIEVESENVFKLAANALQVGVRKACTSDCCI